MKIRRRITILAGVLGVLFGCFFSLLCVGAMAGVFWIFVFGDDPWPNYSGTLIGVVAIVAFLISVVAGILIGHVFGKHIESLDSEDRTKKVRQFYTFFTVVLVLFIGIMVLRKQQIRDHEVKYEQQKKMSKSLEELKADIARISALSVEERSDHSGFDVLITTQGNRATNYEFTLATKEYGVDIQHFKGERYLSAGESTQNIFVAYSTLATQFQKQLKLANIAGTGFSAAYPFTVTLEPILKSNEWEALPSFIQYQADELVEKRKIDVPLKFIISAAEITSCRLEKDDKSL